MKELVTFAEFARKINCTRSAVTKAINSGRLSESVIKEGNRRRLDLSLAIKEWKFNSDPSYKRKKDEDDDFFEDEKIPSMQKSRSIKLFYEAQKLKLEVMEKSGNLLRKDDFEKTFQELIEGTKNAIDESYFKLLIDLRCSSSVKDQDKLEKTLESSKDKLYGNLRELFDDEPEEDPPT